MRSAHTHPCTSRKSIPSPLLQIIFFHPREVPSNLQVSLTCSPGEYGDSNGGSDVGNSAFAGFIYSSRSCGLGIGVVRCSIGCMGTRTGAKAKKPRRKYVMWLKQRQTMGIYRSGIFRFSLQHLEKSGTRYHNSQALVKGASGKAGNHTYITSLSY